MASPYPLPDGRWRVRFSVDGRRHTGTFDTRRECRKYEHRIRFKGHRGEGGGVWRVEPTSCRCGGSYAWLRERPSGAFEMMGCVCHHNPPPDARVALSRVVES